MFSSWAPEAWHDAAIWNGMAAAGRFVDPDGGDMAVNGTRGRPLAGSRNLFAAVSVRTGRDDPLEGAAPWDDRDDRSGHDADVALPHVVNEGLASDGRDRRRNRHVQPHDRLGRCVEQGQRTCRGPLQQPYRRDPAGRIRGAGSDDWQNAEHGHGHATGPGSRKRTPRAPASTWGWEKF